MDYNEIAEMVEKMRELTNAVVQAFIADGFTPDQARRLAVRYICANEPAQAKEEESDD